jgi:glycosyltransferase involved in cell wall biosynthesis
LVFADDWGRHPSSCQHLIGQLSSRYEIHWVNTIGMRRPRLDRATLVRGLEKLEQWIRPQALRRVQEVCAEQQPGHLQPDVVSPRMWPSFSSTIERRINRDLLVRQLRARVAAMSEPPIVVTTIPIVADLVDRIPARRWVYYCVDDFAEWPGLDGATLRQMEGCLIERADVLVAVSPVLQERLGRNRTAHLLTHGVDLELWEGGLGDADSLNGLERPLVAFWGVIDRRMDVAHLERLASDLDSGTIALIGPESDPDPALASMPRVVRLPALPITKLPAVAREASVLIMPYSDLPVTRAMQPLKLKEYLATGRPVVVRDLPATRPWADALDLAATPEVFSRAVRGRISAGLPQAQREARLRLASESWSAKASELESWLFG